MSLFTPDHQPLFLPGSRKRIVRRPHIAELIRPRLSAAPLNTTEIDYDQMRILRAWRSYEQDRPDAVRYFCYELEVLDPGATTPVRFFKVVRFLRLTRVPRYLREIGNDNGQFFAQMRDVLVALREKQVLFVNMMAKTPQLPMIFAYGVQGVGTTLEAACAQADDGFAGLAYCLVSQYQQLHYAPITHTEGEALVRYQQEWRNIAIARGRPIPQGAALGSSAILDGNQTDVENTNNQLESFLRGMSDKSFMLSLITAPLSPSDLNHALVNITQRLSDVRSDQQGSRSVHAGVAVPMMLGTSSADGSGTNHSVGGTHGTASTDGMSAATAHTVGASHTDTLSASQSQSHGTATSLTHNTALGHSATGTDSASRADSYSAGHSYSDGASAAVSDTTSASASHSVGHSESTGITDSTSHTDGTSQTVSHGTNTGQSLANSLSNGTNWSNNAGQSVNAGQTSTGGTNQSAGQSLSQAWGLGTNTGTNEGSNSSVSQGQNLTGTLPGLHGGTSGSQTAGGSYGASGANNTSVSQTTGGNNSVGVSQSLANSLGQTDSIGESAGGSVGHSLTGSNSVGTSDTQSVSNSLSNTSGQSATQTAGVNENFGDSLGVSHGTSQGVNVSQGVSAGIGQSVGQSSSLANGQSLSQGVALGQSASDGTATSHGQSSADGTSVANQSSAGTSTALSQSQAMSDAMAVAMSRTTGISASTSFAPNVGVAISKATFDISKKISGDFLEAQMNRYIDGVEGGGLLYQMFLVCPDRETLLGASTALKAAFWGPGGAEKRLPTPFQTSVIDDVDEASRLLTHFQGFSSYQRREPTMDIVEPYMYSTFVTMGEAAAFVHPPAAESLGLQTQTDSMPVLRMPSDRGNRDVYLGRIVNGERGEVSDARYGLDLRELTHVLIQGTTGQGKTTTAMRFLEQVVRSEQTVVTTPTIADPVVRSTKSFAGALCLDWVRNMRNLANVVPADRFRFHSVSQPELGEFRFNPLALPHMGIDPSLWLGAQADNLAASMGLGDFGRSLIAEMIEDLYSANRLEEVVLRPAVLAADGSGTVLRAANVLPAVNAAELPPSAIRVDAAGNRYANVYTYPELSRLVGLPDLATIVVARIEQAATIEGARAQGPGIRDRLQSLWRRIQYYAPGSVGQAMVAADPDLATRECLAVTDLINPDLGLVTVIETDGLDQEHRRVVLGSLMLAIYRYGLHIGAGAFDQGGRGPGTFLILEEAHELFGADAADDEKGSAGMRARLYEDMFRRARFTGLRLVAMTQNCGKIPSAITSQTTTVLVHRSYDDEDRKRIFSLLNWSNMLNQQIREWRYLGEMSLGYCIVRIDARESYLDSAPVQIKVDPPDLLPVTDAQLAALAATRRLG